VENGFIESFNGRLRGECLNWSGSRRWTTHARSWRGSVSIIITSDRTTRWQIEHRQPLRSCTGRRRNLLRWWGAHSRVSWSSLWSARKPRQQREKGLTLPKISNILCDREWEWFTP